MRDNKSGQILDVQEFIDSRGMSKFQWSLLAVCFLIVFADGFDTASIGYVAPALIQEWGIPRSALGPVLSAAILGMALGALIAGPMADRFGRKKILVISTFAFSVLTFSSVVASSVNTLLVLRFLTGVGLGAAMPNTATLLSEYVPQNKRAFLVNTMYCGFTLGAASGGLVAAALLPVFGWRSVFVVGGTVPLVLAFVLTRFPESVRFLVRKGEQQSKVGEALGRIGGRQFAGDVCFVLNEPYNTAGEAPLSIIFSQPYRFGTLMLWIAYFMGLLVYYLLSSWMPTLVRESGMSLRESSLLTALIPLGATFGTIACGFVMDRGNPRVIVGLAYALAACLIWVTGQTLGVIAVLVVALLLAGLFLGAAQGSLPVIAAMNYPTAARASGVAWMIGVGRIGGIIGAMSGGTLIGFGLTLSGILSLLSIPTFVSALAMVSLAFGRRRSRLTEVAPKSTAL